MTSQLATLIANQIIPQADPLHVEAVRRLVEYQHQAQLPVLARLREDMRVAVIVNALQQKLVPATHQQAHFRVGFSSQPELQAIRIGRYIFGVEGEDSWMSLSATRLKSMPPHIYQDQEVRPIKANYNLYDQLIGGPAGPEMEEASNALVAWMDSMQLGEQTAQVSMPIRTPRL